jgi:hypothetical protein
MRVAVIVKATTDLEAGDAEIEIRPVLEMDEFRAEFTPALREQEIRQRELAERLAAATRS